jgi:hypothetical protein
MSGITLVCDTQEEFNRLKDRATKLRIILLDRKEKNMFCKLSSFDARDKKKFVREINDMWNSMTDEEIDAEFNEICCDKLFASGKDVSSYPTEIMTYPDHSVLYNPTPLEEITGGAEEMKSGELVV